MIPTDFRTSTELRAALKSVAVAAKTGSEAELEVKLEEAVRIAGQEITRHVLKEVEQMRKDELSDALHSLRGR